MSLEEKLEKWRKLEEEARELRRREADWSFIESQPPRIRIALKLYVETGDIRLAARVAELSLEEFRELMRRAKVPLVV
ncbi:MAG: hypothetical protein QXH90_08210 [Candidatus Korarchaeum sp.]